MRCLETAALRVQVADLGAELCSLQAQGAEFLWQGDARHWAERAPILFPIVGRAWQGELAINGRAYPMPIHGFARSQTFALTALGQDHCTHELRANPATRAAYPFEFVLRVAHRLQGAQLTITLTVENLGEVPMPFGIGLHPGLQWPLPQAAGQRHWLDLEGAAAPLAAELQGGLLTGKPLPSPFTQGRLALSEAVFAADSSLVFPEGCGQRLTYAAEGGSALEMAWQGFSSLVLWHPQGAGFVCLEPWQGLPQHAEAGRVELAARPNSLSLAAGAQASFALSLTPRLAPAPDHG